MKKYVPNGLIINADDFGLHTSINRAIHEAYTRGVLTHASIMAHGPVFGEAVEIAAENPGLALGVHLTLPGNVMGQRQFPLLRECSHYAVHQKALEEVWRRQVLLVKSHGIEPTHLDSHQHTHYFPGILSVMVRLATEFGINRIRWLDFPRLILAKRKLGALSIKVFQRASLLSRDAKNSSLQMVPAIGFNESGNMGSENMLKTIEMVKSRYAGRCVEIFCHPGDDNSRLRRDFGWEYDWESELSALCDPYVKYQIEQYPKVS